MPGRSWYGYARAEDSLTMGSLVALLDTARRVHRGDTVDDVPVPLFSRRHLAGFRRRTSSRERSREPTCRRY